MKRLWKVINRERRKDSLTAKQMAKKLRMDPAHLSRLRTGQIRDLSPESLSHLVAGLGKSPALRAELLTAYLSDKLKGGGPFVSEVAEKVADGLIVAEEEAEYGRTPASTITEAGIRAGLDRRIATALGVLAEHARRNRRLQMLLVSLAGYVRKE